MYHPTGQKNHGSNNEFGSLIVDLKHQIGRYRTEQQRRLNLTPGHASNEQPSPETVANDLFDNEDGPIEPSQLDFNDGLGP